ncbi:hypothetical protein QKA_1875 [Clostridioides difficile DA00165]|nr:hypothetical protein QKA_1875 [Clostridioides difficile DA00165]
MIKNGILFLTNQLYSGGNLYEIQLLCLLLCLVLTLAVVGCSKAKDDLLLVLL